jgi:hypothetical protein
MTLLNGCNRVRKSPDVVKVENASRFGISQTFIASDVCLPFVITLNERR